MQINITLVFQAIQFFIAYYFLYNFMFVPAYAILLKEEAFEKKLYDNVDQSRLEKEQLQEKSNNRWAFLKKKLFENCPDALVESRGEKTDKNGSLYFVEKQNISKEEEEKTTSFLVDKLSDVSK